MSDQAVHPHLAARAARPPRRRWSDAHPLAIGAFCAGLAALAFHALPGDAALSGVRNVLTATALVTAALILGLLLLDRLGRAPNGRRHPGRRGGDRPWR